LYSLLYLLLYYCFILAAIFLVSLLFRKFEEKQKNCTNQAIACRKIVE